MVSREERRGARREQECLLSSPAITSVRMVLVMEGVSRVVATSNQLIHDLSHGSKLPAALLRLHLSRRRATRRCLDKMRRDSGWTLAGILALGFPCTWIHMMDSGWSGSWVLAHCEIFNCPGTTGKMKQHR